MRRRMYAAGLGLLVGIAASGCAQERDPINRVQPDALKKSFFVGDDLHGSHDDPVFYSRGYNTGQSYDQGDMFYGTASGVNRVRWEITEDMLIARQAYQLQPGRDDKGVPGGTANGTVVAAYKILSHFDVRRAYNSGTGEELNVVEENSSDRPWYDREYIRVDWSSNQVADPMYLEMLIGKWFGEPKMSPLAYYVNDPSSEDAPHFEEDQGYFEVTNRYWVEPGSFYFSWGAVPACLVWGYLTGGNDRDCNAQSVNIRLSFWKVNPEDHDFERLELTRSPEDIVNNFGTMGESLYVQYGAALNDYDPAYGYLDEGFHKFATQLNIWKRAHTDVECWSNNDGNNDGTADDCESYGGSKGSQCDLFERKCTIPYRDREVRTRGWFLNKEMPALYQDPIDEYGNRMTDDLGAEIRGATEDVAFSWDQMFRAAVASAREVECRRTGDGNRDECHSWYFNPDKVMVSYGNWLIDDATDTTPVHVVCHNPVREYDNHEVCGPTGYRARLGDLRKLFLIDWPTATNSPFGGVTNLGTDPLTGEIIGNTSLTVHVDRRARFFVEPLLVAMGDISLEDYLKGGAQAKYAQLTGGTLPTPPTAAEIHRRTHTGSYGSLAASGMGKSYDGSVQQKMASILKDRVSTTNDPTMLAKQSLRNQQLLAPLQGTGVEEGLVDGQWLAGAGFDPSIGVNSSTIEMTSPLRNMDASRLREIRETMARKMGHAGVCFSPLEEAMQIGNIVNAPLVKYFQDKYGHLSGQEKYDAIFNEVKIESFKGVLLHEMGHALGMRHQFASSWDAMNYMPQYWQLRTNRGNGAKSCEAKVTADGSTCMGPRYLDPYTPDELGTGSEPRPRLEYFANTSTMEYQSERFSETSGLGTWDYHMTRAIYGRVLETYDPKHTNRADLEKVVPRMWSHLADGDLVNDVVHADDPAMEKAYNTQLFGTDPFVHTWHYTKLAREIKLFDEGRDCRDATDQEKAAGKWRIVHNKVCQAYPRDIAAWQDFETSARPELWNEEVLNWHTRNDAKSGGDQVRWSYKIGESYYPSYVHTNMVDSGADVYEITRNAVEHFEAMYPVSYFRRGDRSRSTWFIPGAVSEDYFEILRSYHWSTANELLRYLSFGKDLYDILAEDDNWSRPGFMSNSEAFNALVRHVLVPQPGDYVVRAGDPSGVYDAVSNPSSGSDFFIKIIDGRFVDEAYDNTSTGGGSWNYERYWTRAGFYMEKSYAFLALCDSRPTLSTISRDNYLDDRGVRLNFRSDRPQAFDRLLGGILSEDWHAVAPYVTPDKVGDEGQSIPQYLVLDAENGINRAANAKVLFPNIGYQQQLYSALFSALYARENTDMTLIHKMRLWIDGVEANISDTAFPKPEDQVRFYDPHSGFTYIARRFGTEEIDGRQVERGISSRILQRANQLVTLSYQVEKDTQGAPVLDEYGRPKLVLDTNGQPIELDAFTSKRGELIRYVGLVDSIKQLGLYLGQGPY